MNLSINNAIQNQPNFQARIKIGKPSLKTIAQTAIGTSAVVGGSAAAGVGVLSVDALGDTGSITHALPIDKGTADSLHQGLQGSLYSADTKHDAAGEIKGIPVQSTIVPSGFVGSAAMSFNAGSNAFINAYGKDNLLASTQAPINTSEALSANKLFQKSAFGTAYSGLAAASLYSGFDGNPIGEDSTLQGTDSQKLSAMSGSLSVSVPLFAGSIYGADKISNTKSGQFVKETLSENKSNTNIPS